MSTLIDNVAKPWLRIIASDLALIISRPFSWVFWGASPKWINDAKAACAVVTLLLYGALFALLLDVIAQKSGLEMIQFSNHPRFQMLSSIFIFAFLIPGILYAAALLSAKERDGMPPVALATICVVLCFLIVAALIGGLL